MDEVQLRMQKAGLWEEAVGKLRAMVMAEAYRGMCRPMTNEMYKAARDRWTDIDKVVEDFISMMKDEGYNE